MRLNKYPSLPQNVTEGFACEQAKGAEADSPKYTCLFNIRDDPCEHKDQSGSQARPIQLFSVSLSAAPALNAIDSCVVTLSRR